MLFNSFEFICVFLPLTLVIYFILGRCGRFSAAIAWLVIASLIFYSWWNPIYIGVLGASLVCNYGLGSRLSQAEVLDQRRSQPHEGWSGRKILLSLGIILNLGILGYFKYTNFLIDNVNSILNANFNPGNVVLPLGISFFTFQQVAYLVDAYRGEAKEYNFGEYCLFVTFFPQLIAGPIVHHGDILPQFSQPEPYQFRYRNLTIGLTIFVIGLAKKIFLADSLATTATPVFNAATDGTILGFGEAWAGAIAYSLQLYFDFSGYSDMAVGIAQMFGISLPINFNSPYKSISIREFWRRWHITLSNFLRDYLYIPLGGSRQGSVKHYGNLLMTMVLGGLWHGAGWTFIIWGGLHGSYLVINQFWSSWRRSLGQDPQADGWLMRGLGLMLTMLAVIVGWVFFRVESLHTALSMLSSMAGLTGINLGLTLPIDRKFVLVGLFCVLLLPNTQQWLGKYYPTLSGQTGDAIAESSIWHRLRWQPTFAMSFITGTVAFFTLLKAISVEHSEFLYFDF
jgi:alginate O-acetyltransferase complex protein AlgI